MLETTKNEGRSGAPAIRTERLLLVEITPALLDAEAAGNDALAAALGMRVPGEWPPEHWDAGAIAYLREKMEARPEDGGWARYVIERTADAGGVLVGTCGTVGPVPGAAEVEVGYSTLPSFQRRGYATEAVGALLAWIFAFPDVQSVCAQTFPELRASIRVMEKNGLTFAGAGFETGTVLYRRLRT